MWPFFFGVGRILSDQIVDEVGDAVVVVLGGAVVEVAVRLWERETEVVLACGGAVVVTAAGSAASVPVEVAAGVDDGAEVAEADGVEVVASLGPGEGAPSAVSAAAAGDDADPGCTSRASVTAAAPPTSHMADSAGRGLSRPWRVEPAAPRSTPATSRA